jgi:two-component system chemotaxis sensor kinase CheA
VRLEGEQVTKGIEWVRDVSFFRLRGNLLPLVHLDRELELVEAAADASTLDAINIVVLKADDRQFGLVVDTINDTEEIVVKPLSKHLKCVSAFAGATIMGDGRVALILDVLGLAQRAHVVSDLKATGVTTGIDTSAHVDSAELQTLLLFRAGEHERMAIPLHSVARLEEFPATMIERSGDRPVVQYRGKILPLATLGSSDDARHEGPRHVIVFSARGRSIGLMVDQILDIVSDRIVVQHRLSRPGVLGSAVIQGRVTDLLDVTSILRSLDPEAAAA